MNHILSNPQAHAARYGPLSPGGLRCGKGVPREYGRAGTRATSKKIEQKMNIWDGSGAGAQDGRRSGRRPGRWDDRTRNMHRNVCVQAAVG